ncbi:MAG: hypothetical protein RMK20_07725 [Verrucomicrobiales bacterium]|nr:hypothetical protein [Verrucomicrobiales bacterium]
MIASFFQSLERQRVEYLLISGQATVLYGAATFSEDIDLWINPTAGNRARFLAALQECRARYYKITPPFTVELLQRGHGFHFTLPGDEVGEIFLDVLGRPPRVGSFATVSATARRMKTDWGTIPTIGIQPLVELKKTQRLEDYPIVSKLVLAWFRQPECSAAAGDYLWALENLFTLPELAAFFSEHPVALSYAGQFNADVADFGRQCLERGAADEEVEQRVSRFLQSRVAELQRADRRYWRSILEDLRSLRAAGALMPEGAPVVAGG